MIFILVKASHTHATYINSWVYLQNNKSHRKLGLHRNCSHWPFKTCITCRKWRLTHTHTVSSINMTLGSIFKPSQNVVVGISLDRPAHWPKIPHLAWRAALRPAGSSPTGRSSGCPWGTGWWCSQGRPGPRPRPPAPPPTAAAGPWRRTPSPRPALLRWGRQDASGESGGERREFRQSRDKRDERRPVSFGSGLRGLETASAVIRAAMPLTLQRLALVWAKLWSGGHMRPVQLFNPAQPT